MRERKAQRMLRHENMCFQTWMPSPLINARDFSDKGIDSTPVVKIAPATGTTAVNATKPESGEFEPDLDCNVCREEQSRSQVVVFNDGQTSVPAEVDEMDDVFRNLPHDQNAKNCLLYMIHFTESKFMLFIHVLLLAIPLSSGFMGAKYMDQCFLSPETPVFLFMMGVIGTIVIFCRILLITQKIMLPRRGEWQALGVIMIVGVLAIVVCLATEMFSFSRKAPSFEEGDPRFCHETFYNFTYWINWTCVFVLTLMFLLELPKCSWSSSQAELVS
ncbi:uncharacterized protein NPIL_370431 [Nephila pilipes]|uniref:Uncharacterized protein n=1 Tax=Nephila pilipes TaxID=299642 RepID=A0A8X6NNB3_NEPPI|nr:uncharacterized protein NPIL_370431 [Nephila pilipes]